MIRVMQQGPKRMTPKASPYLMNDRSHLSTIGASMLYALLVLRLRDAPSRQGRLIGTELLSYSTNHLACWVIQQDVKVHLGSSF